MTFVAQETSQEDGQPIELYEFRLGTEEFNLSTAATEETFASVTYDPVTISRTNLIAGPEERTEVISIEIDAAHPLPRKYINIVPGTAATLTIKRVHRSDGQTVVIFKGVVRSVGFSNNGTRALIAVLPLTRGLSKSVPRLLYSSICNHVLYDSRCGVQRLDFRFIGTVTVIDGNDYTIPGVAASVANPATSGFIKIGNTDFRLIRSQSGDVLTLLLPFNTTDVDVGTEVEVFAGCDHTIATCKTQFDIVVNYGGFAFVPTRNPFESGLD